MIRTHMLPCALLRAEADALNRESGRVYTETLVWHYRIYRRKGIWLSPGASERLGDFLSPTTLHAHSRDAAQQAFYKACKTAKANRGMGAKYPHKRKYYRPTIWKNSGIRVQNGALLLARARGLAPIAVILPPALHALDKAAFVEMRRYACSTCGFRGHRDAVGAANQVSKAVHGDYGHVQPRHITYRRVFRRSSPDMGHVACDASNG